MAYAGVTKEQIEKAREMDLLTYLQSYEPGELINDGANRYTTKTHGSIVISKGKWIWNSGGVGGVSALDYLVKIKSMSFISAVEMLAGANFTNMSTPNKPHKIETKEKRELRLPWKTNIPSAALAYLQSRGISSDIIKSALNQGIIYESKYYNPKSEFHQEKVCVFVGKDEHGKERFATMRGINKNFKRDAGGSDKLINFHIPSVTLNCSAVAVFESPIDALSHLALEEMSNEDNDMHRLSLGGTAHVALISFLERHPEINHVVLCVDNDDGGRKAANKIKEILAEDEKLSSIIISENFPHMAKDYNELLMNKIQSIKKNKELIRSNRADISI